MIKLKVPNYFAPDDLSAGGVLPPRPQVPEIPRAHDAARHGRIFTTEQKREMRRGGHEAIMQIAEMWVARQLVRFSAHDHQFVLSKVFNHCNIDSVEGVARSLLRLHDFLTDERRERLLSGEEGSVREWWRLAEGGNQLTEEDIVQFFRDFKREERDLVLRTQLTVKIMPWLINDKRKEGAVDLNELIRTIPPARYSKWEAFKAVDRPDSGSTDA